MSGNEKPFSNTMRSPKNGGWEPHACQSAAERDHEIDIEHGRKQLSESISTALGAVHQADRALRKLIDAFDVEYAEGELGEHMREHIRQARLHLTAMEARQFNED